ncbi:IucA/IucC family siderophore biosynthesis protein [Bacillus sp. H-16]|uniref:IucA/IucC family protein n=1 Tax=Alteribacter salitolerans TaxID=2912333 RepID=UPI001963AD6D|nr:IucA/IucC family protein [Alteribacter salitolerans]MBM7095913.1 IucA/IucC family siderophore biosynthesis protein [Alteribacter salitolerans]
MINVKEIAENATMQSFLNCYLRETGNGKEAPDVLKEAVTSLQAGKWEHVITVDLDRQGVTLLLPIQYWSLTGRHLFAFPLYYLAAGRKTWQQLDYVTAVTLIVKEWLIGNGKEGAEDELIHRVILSCQTTKSSIEYRLKDKEALTNKDVDFIDAEQSLLFGHLMHPTPKSKQGMTEKQEEKYSPEYKGTFLLHYFSVDKEYILQDSSLSIAASEAVYHELYESDNVDKEWLEKNEEEGRALIPAHPLQIETLLEKQEVQKLMKSGAVTYLGPLGKPYTATSSFRTVYNPESPFMYKFSVPVKVTNSLRVNQPKELARGVEVSRLLNTEVGERLHDAFPRFQIINDPAYMNVKTTEYVSGFEMIIRENPFYEKSENTSVIAALCQDHAYGGKARIHAIITDLAKREGRPVSEVSVDWFKHYLSITLDPMLWLYKTYGIALEAHQQNSVIQMKGGYPDTFYYRDNQGYYFCQSAAEKLKALVPGLNEDSDTVCEDHVADERFRYYFFFNHLFGLINAFGANGLVKEERLIGVLRAELEKHEPKEGSQLLQSLLEESDLPCKANLLTRLYDMDELVGPMEAQSVYTKVPNPLENEVKLHYAL